MNLSDSRSVDARRLAGVGVVGLLHVVLVYALLNGMARKMMDVIKPPLETRIVEEVKPPPPPPPERLPPPRMQLPPPPFVPPPEVSIQQPIAPAITAVSNVRPDPAPVRPMPPPVPAAPKHDAVRVDAVIDARNCKKPEYPSAAIRDKREGKTTLMLLVGVDGRVADSYVQKSSGHPDLDDAARAALSLCQFKPATVDGKPEQVWTDLNYVWRLY